MKKIIHFSHANSFPSKVYCKLFKELEKNYSIGYYNQIGHNLNFPVKDNWNELVDELISYVKTNYNQPIYGVGHSLGGVLTFKAAARHPELFKEIIMLDSPILGIISSYLLKFAKFAGLINFVTPAGRTLGRRSKWENIDEAFDYFNKHEFFSKFDREVLKDYVFGGTKKTDDGVELSFKPEIEYQIYHTIPTDLYKYKNKVTTPITLIFGNEDTVLRKHDFSQMKKNYNISLKKVEGGHLFPFENPSKTAELIQQTIEK